MRTYDEAFAAATDKPAFSNGTEGEGWMGLWCDRCLHDRSAHTDAPADPRNNGLIGCALVAVALMSRTPVEWIERERLSLGDRYHCTEFRDENDGDGGPLYPPPEDPDQLTIFDEFVDQAVEQFEASEPAVLA